MSDKRIPKGVGGHTFGQPGSQRRRTDRLLNRGFLQVVTAPDARLSVQVVGTSGKCPSPAPRTARFGAAAVVPTAQSFQHAIIEPRLRLARAWSQWRSALRRELVHTLTAPIDFLTVHRTSTTTTGQPCGKVSMSRNPMFRLLHRLSTSPVQPGS